MPPKEPEQLPPLALESEQILTLTPFTIVISTYSRPDSPPMEVQPMPPKKSGPLAFITYDAYDHITSFLPPACCFMLYNTNKSLRSLEQTRYKNPPLWLSIYFCNNYNEETGLKNLWASLTFQEKLNLYALPPSSHPESFDGCLTTILTFTTQAEDDKTLKHLFAKRRVKNDIDLLYAAEGVTMPSNYDLDQIINYKLTDRINDHHFLRQLDEKIRPKADIDGNNIILLQFLRCGFTIEQTVRFAANVIGWHKELEHGFKDFFSLLQKTPKDNKNDIIQILTSPQLYRNTITYINLILKSMLQNLNFIQHLRALRVKFYSAIGCELFFSLLKKIPEENTDDIIKFITSIKDRDMDTINVILEGLLLNLTKEQVLDRNFNTSHLTLLKTGQYKFEDIILFPLNHQSITAAKLPILNQLIQLKRIRANNSAAATELGTAAMASSASATTDATIIATTLPMLPLHSTESDATTILGAAAMASSASAATTNVNLTETEIELFQGNQRYTAMLRSDGHIRII